MNLHTCQAGFEDRLTDELAAAGVEVAAAGPGWVVSGDGVPDELVFRHRTLVDAVECEGSSVNALGGAMADWFLESCRDERFEESWPLMMEAAGDEKGLRRRAVSVRDRFLELVGRKARRVARLAAKGADAVRSEGRGVHGFFVDFDRFWVSRDFVSGGQRRMSDDSGAPSRSYLKVEEAYGLLGASPQAGQRVVDLGAAPGGWSYSAARRGADVVAVDNGPLKAGALDHPRIEHRKEDAFDFRVTGDPVDWLFCDLVEDPHHVLEDILLPWAEQGWCRSFVINLKLGRTDVSRLIGILKDPAGKLVRFCPFLRVRHLFHDRDEITLVGRVDARTNG